MKTIFADWLGLEIGIFTDYQEYKAFAKEKGIQPFEMRAEVKGFFEAAQGDDELMYFYAVYPKGPDTEVKTIVHESIHLADHIFEHRGFAPCSETRAYFTSWIFDHTLNFLQDEAKEEIENGQIEAVSN